MQSKDIPDSSITASSSYNLNYATYLGRLHFLAQSGKAGGWAAAGSDKTPWFQVDLGSWTKVSAILTQGRQDADQWVKTYSVSFSFDGVFFETVTYENGSKKVFKY